MSNATELQKNETDVQALPQSQSQQAYAVLRPRVDLLESDDSWLLRAEMPGVDETHVDVTLERQVLTISGVAELTEPEGFERHYGEFRPRRYERSFRLPEEIERNGVEATVEHGVLSIRIPKGKEAQPQRIAVKTRQ
jgi:HSP20 family molecular chaperone IbpA